MLVAQLYSKLSSSILIRSSIQALRTLSLLQSHHSVIASKLLAATARAPPTPPATQSTFADKPSPPSSMANPPAPTFSPPASPKHRPPPLFNAAPSSPPL